MVNKMEKIKEKFLWLLNQIKHIFLIIVNWFKTKLIPALGRFFKCIGRGIKRAWIAVVHFFKWLGVKIKQICICVGHFFRDKLLKGIVKGLRWLGKNLNKKVLRMPLWLVILLGFILTIILLVGIIIAIVAIIWHSPRHHTIVTTDVKVESVEFTNEEPIIINIGDEYQLTYVVLPTNAKNKNVSFTSLDTEKATVSDEGLVKALTGGNVTIEITTQDGNLTDTIVIVIKLDPIIKNLDKEVASSLSSIEINNQVVDNVIECNLNSPLEIKFNEIVSEANYSWSSSNQNILKVLSFEDGVLKTSILSTGTVALTLTITSEFSETVVKEFYINITKDVIIEKKTIQSISVLGLIDEYYEKEEIDINNISLLISYSDQSTNLLKLNTLNLIDYLDTNIANCELDSDNKCIKTYNLEYVDEENETSFAFTISYKVIKLLPIDIKLIGLLTKYKQSDNVAISSVIVTYNNGYIEYLDITDVNSNIATIDMVTTGKKELTVSYNDFEKTFTFYVIEKEKYLVGMVIDGLNDNYYLNEVITPSKVTLFYSNSETEEIDQSLLTSNINEIDMNTIGSKELIYTYEGIQFKKEINVSLCCE